jgi:uncharacterized membrane protein YedE/YeeE
MARKIPIVFILLGSLFLLGASFWLLPVKEVNAQCKTTSSCKTCHEVQGQDPVNTKGAWHTDHAYADLCTGCHSGKADVADKDQAHQGLVTQYQEMPANCKQCHTDDLETKFKQYAGQLNVSDTTSLQQAQKNDSQKGLSLLLGQAPADINVSGEITKETGGAAPSSSGSSNPSNASSNTGAATTPPQKPENTTGNIILGVLLGIGVLGGGSYITWNERRLAQANGVRPQSWIIERIRKEHWSPYAAGILLGITCILTVLLANRTLGASFGIASITSTLLHWVAPQAADQSMYFKFIATPGFNWEIALLIGMFLGGMAGAWTSGTLKLRWNDDEVWIKIFGPQRWKRFVLGFIGAVIIQIGAGIAGGCTSGLAISGGMFLAPSAFLFMAGMFASGILVALIIYRRRY